MTNRSHLCKDSEELKLYNIDIDSDIDIESVSLTCFFKYLCMYYSVNQLRQEYSGNKHYTILAIMKRFNIIIYKSYETDMTLYNIFSTSVSSALHYSGIELNKYTQIISYGLGQFYLHDYDRNFSVFRDVVNRYFSVFWDMTETYRFSYYVINGIIYYYINNDHIYIDHLTKQALCVYKYRKGVTKTKNNFITKGFIDKYCSKCKHLEFCNNVTNRDSYLYGDISIVPKTVYDMCFNGDEKANDFCFNCNKCQHFNKCEIDYLKDL